MVSDAAAVFWFAAFLWACKKDATGLYGVV